MQKIRYILLVAIAIGFVTISFSQHKRYAIKNGVGIEGGITQYDIITDNFETTKGNGWIVGASAVVDLPHKWYTVSYSIRVSENSFNISGRPTQSISTNEDLEYKLMAAQVGFTFHVKLISDNLTLDLGPQLQYNGKLELKDDTQSNYYVNNFTNLQAEDITDITQFNANGMVGLSAGFGAFRIKGQYMYGFTNMLNKLNDADFASGLNTKFKGNQSMIAFTAMITF